MKRLLWILGVVGCGVLTAGMPSQARAQDAGSEATRNAPITLDTESATLYSALKTLFKQANADFTIVDSLKSIPVTVHIRQPFRIALETVLKSTGEPITFTVENGVYQIEPRRDEPPLSLGEDPQTAAPVVPRPPIMRALKARNGSGLELVAMLGGSFVPWTTGFFPPYVGANPFAGNPLMGGFGGGNAGMNGMGGMNGNGGNNAQGFGGAASGLGGNFTGFYALPGLGLGFFGSNPNAGGSNNGNGGAGGR